MADEMIAKVNITCDVCGKTHTEVGKIIALVNWDGKKMTLCSECILDCVTVMIHQDREWFERQIEEIKAHPPSPEG
jgi:hypothetical protein